MLRASYLYEHNNMYIQTKDNKIMYNTSALLDILQIK